MLFDFPRKPAPAFKKIASKPKAIVIKGLWVDDPEHAYFKGYRYDSLTDALVDANAIDLDDEVRGRKCVDEDDLVVGRTYWYRFSSVDEWNNESLKSDPASETYLPVRDQDLDATEPNKPGTPTLTQISATYNNDGSIETLLQLDFTPPASGRAPKKYFVEILRSETVGTTGSVSGYDLNSTFYSKKLTKVIRANGRFYHKARVTPVTHNEIDGTPSDYTTVGVKPLDLVGTEAADALAAAHGALGLGTASTLDFDTDGTLATNSDSRIATQKAVKTYADTKVAGAGTVTSGNPVLFSGTTGKVLADVSFSSFKTSLSLTKSDVGLGSVDNTSDLGKPVSTATQTALDAKVTGPASVTDGNPAVFDTTSGKLIKQVTFSAFKTSLSLTKSDVGLGNVDNTSDTNKPVSTAQQTALNLKADLASPALTGTPTAPTASGTTNTTQIATTAMVQSALSAYIAAQDVLVFKGVIDCSGNPNYPAADAGHVYKVGVAGKIGGASGPAVEVGDVLTCITDSSSSGNHATVGANWIISQVNIDGAVTGPTSATNGNIAVFNGTTGKVISEISYSMFKTNASLVIGTNIQAWDTDLDAYAGISTAGLVTRTGIGTATARSVAGTANQITVTNGDGVSGSPTISLPADVQIPTVITAPNTGLHILDTDASHDLILKPGSNLTADRTLTVTTGDNDRTLDISASNATISAAGAAIIDDSNQIAVRQTIGIDRVIGVIADDAVGTLNFGAAIAGMAIVIYTNGAVAGIFAMRPSGTPVSAVISIGSITWAVSGSTLTGTTGIDGQITVSPDASGVITIENRSGTSRTFYAAAFQQSVS